MRVTQGTFPFLPDLTDDEIKLQPERTEVHDRKMNYTVRPYAADKPHGQRYQTNGS